MEEITLRAPVFFDETIGYWTGEPDRDALLRALAAVPETPEVARAVQDDRVTLRGPTATVREEARRLREAGLE